MAAEMTGRGELAELVTDHLLRDEHRHVLAAVVHRDRVPDHVREDRRGARPGADHLLLAALVHRDDARQQALLHEGPLLRAARHLALLLPAAPAADDELVGFLVLAAGALAERRHAPRGDRMAAALGLALAAAVRVVDRVHRRASHGGPLSEPARASGLAAGDVAVIDVADLAHGRPTGEEHAPHLAGRETKC